MLDYLAFNIALLQVGEDIVQLFIRCHHVHPELPENTVGGLRHFAVQDVKRQAVAQGQFTDDRPVRAVPGEGELDDRALQLICQFGIEGLFLRVLAHLADKLPGDRLLRMRKHAQHLPLFHHLAVLHYRHAVADFAHHMHLMLNEYDGQVKTTVNVQEQIEDLIGGLRIQRRGGFVTQQYVRMIGQRAGNAHTLFLPAA